MAELFLAWPMKTRARMDVESHLFLQDGICRCREANGALVADRRQRIQVRMQEFLGVLDVLFRRQALLPIRAHRHGKVTKRGPPKGHQWLAFQRSPAMVSVDGKGCTPTQVEHRGAGFPILSHHLPVRTPVRGAPPSRHQVPPHCKGHTM